MVYGKWNEFIMNPAIITTGLPELCMDAKSHNSALRAHNSHYSEKKKPHNVA